MPATIRYKQEFINKAIPVESSISFADDGLVTGSATLVIDGERAPVAVNDPLPIAWFKLGGQGVQGIFAESISIEKRNGLFFCRINAVGATSPQRVIIRKDVSPRSFSKSQTRLVTTRTQSGNSASSTTQEIVEVYSFDYSAETYTLSTVIVEGGSASFGDAPKPNAVRVWNSRGFGFRTSGTPSGSEAPSAVSGPIIAYSRILESENVETRGPIIRITATYQFVYE